MPRYVTRSGGWIDDDWERFYSDDAEPHRPDLSVDEHQPVDTGLISATGEPIYRVPNPIGFGRDGEW